MIRTWNAATFQVLNKCLLISRVVDVLIVLEVISFFWDVKIVTTKVWVTKLPWNWLPFACDFFCLVTRLMSLMPIALNDLFRCYSASVLNNLESITSRRMCDTWRLEAPQGYRGCNHLPLFRVSRGNSTLDFWPLILESIFSPEIWAEYEESILILADTGIDTRHFFFFKLDQNAFSPSRL